MNKRVATTMFATAATLGMSALGAQAATAGTTTGNGEATPVVATAAKTATTVTEAKTQVNQAKQSQTNASSAVSNAKTSQGVTQQAQNSAAADQASAQKAADAKNAAVSQAQAVKDQATAENINAANSAATQAANDVATANKAVSSAQSSVSPSQDAVNQAQSGVTSAASAASTANQAQSAAQQQADSAAQNVTNETNKLNNLTPDKINTAKDTTNKAITADQSTINTTTTNLNNAKQAVTDATSNVNKKSAAAQNATSDLTKAQTDVTTATTANVTAQSAKTVAQQTVNSVQAKEAALPKLNINVATWRKVIEDQNNGDKNFQTEYEAFVEQVLKDNNYTPSIADTKTVISSFSALTQAQREELMSFALDVINQGVTLWNNTSDDNLTSTREDLKISQQVADAYSKANNNIWTPGSQHLDAELSDVMLKYHFGMVGENWGGTFLAMHLDYGTLNFGVYKEEVYQDIVQMLFADADSNFGHMMLWCEMMRTGEVGLGFDKYGSTHFITHGSFAADSGADTTPIYAQTSIVKANVATAKTDLTTKTKTATTAQNVLASAVATSASATTANISAQTALKSAKSDLTTKTAKAQTLNTQLATAKTSLAKNQAKLAILNQELANLSTARSTQAGVVSRAKENATKADQILDAAKTATAEAQTALNTAKQNLTAKQNSLTAAKQAVTDAQKVVDQKQAALDKANDWESTLTQSDARLANLKVDLRYAKAALATKTAAYNDAVTVNNAAKAKLQAANTAKRSADQTYNRAVQLVETLQAKQALETELANEKNNPTMQANRDKAKESDSIKAMKNYADKLKEAAKLAQEQANESGNASDQIVADQLVSESQAAIKKYETALDQLNTETTTADNNGQVVNVATTSHNSNNVVVLRGKTGVVIPATKAIISRTKSPLAKLESTDAKLPQTDEKDSTKVGMIAGILMLLTTATVAMFGSKRRKGTN